MALIDRVVHRLKLRDLRLLNAVVQSKSIAKAAAQLNITAPAVSKAISELEHTIGVRLLERSRQGIEPTPHGLVLIERSRVLFDELRQGLVEIENLSDPMAGEIRMAASIPMAAGILPVIVGSLLTRYPRMAIHTREIPIGSQQFEAPVYRELRERTVDLAFGPIVRRQIDADFQVEEVFDDPLVVATGTGNRSSRLRNPKLKDLMDQPWCLPPADSVAGARCVAAFRASGLDLPPKTVTAMSVHLQIGLLATQQFFTMFPGSLMQFAADRLSMKGLPIKLDVPSLQIGIVTLKGRAINPAIAAFARTARETAGALAKSTRNRPPTRRASA
jgi:DNA-binding transcriptional LysR family regulator